MDLLQVGVVFRKWKPEGKFLSGIEFEDCVFEQCDLSSMDLSNNSFMDCSFEDCNLGLTSWTNSSLKNVQFRDCKLLGIDFSRCQDFLFEVHFEACLLDLCSFERKKMNKTKFENCSLKEVNFVSTQLEKAIFEDCNLANAIFENTNLKEANLSTSTGFTIDPDANEIKKARFSREGILGLLSKYDIKIEY